MIKNFIGVFMFQLLITFIFLMMAGCSSVTKSSDRIPASLTDAKLACQIIESQYKNLIDSKDSKYPKAYQTYSAQDSAGRDSLKELLLCSNENAWRGCLNECQSDDTFIRTLSLQYGFCRNMFQYCCPPEKQGSGYNCSK